LSRRRRETPDFLPRSAGARVVTGLLALPCFVVMATLFVGLSFVSGPPTGPGDIIMSFLLGQLLLVASLFTLLALIWAIAAPEWIARLLEAQVRPMILLAGAFLVVGGLVPLYLSIVAREFVAALLMFISILVGVVILLRTPLRSPP
jgi:hypothetical protein